MNFNFVQGGGGGGGGKRETEAQPYWQLLIDGHSPISYKKEGGGGGKRSVPDLFNQDCSSNVKLLMKRTSF